MLSPWENILWSAKDIYDEEERGPACRNATNLIQYAFIMYKLNTSNAFKNM